MSNDIMTTRCVNCGEERELTTLEVLIWMEQHGPGKCNLPKDDDD